MFISQALKDSSMHPVVSPFHHSPLNIDVYRATAQLRVVTLLTVGKIDLFRFRITT